MLDIKIKKTFIGYQLKRIWGLLRSQFARLKELGTSLLPVRFPAFDSLAWRTWRVKEIQEGLSFASLCEPTHQGKSA